MQFVQISQSSHTYSDVSAACRQKVVKWNGWGYSDSGFTINENKDAAFLGKRY